jgi:hypothetical protein
MVAMGQAFHQGLQRHDGRNAANFIRLCGAAAEKMDVIATIFTSVIMLIINKNWL